MQIIFNSHHVDDSQTLREFTQEKFTKLLRHFDRIISINVTFALEKVSHVAEATIQLPGKAIHASSESTTDMYSAVDLLIDKLDRLVKKHKDKIEQYRD